MKNEIVAVLAAGLLLGISVAAQTPAAIPKTGNISARKVLSATPKALPLGKERVQLTYESFGAITSDTGEGLVHNASARCLGAFRALNGVFDDEAGSCVYTRPDGDQMFVEYKAAGRLGGEARGTAAIVGGTGRLAGIQGHIDWTRVSARPAAEGTAQVILSLNGAYKLP